MGSYVDRNGVAYQESTSGYDLPIASSLNSLQGVKIETDYGNFQYGDQQEDKSKSSSSEFPTWGYVAVAVGGAVVLWYLFGGKKRR